MKNTKYSNKEITAMQKMRDAGEALTDIASKFLCTRNTVYRLTLDSASPLLKKKEVK